MEKVSHSFSEEYTLPRDILSKYEISSIKVLFKKENNNKILLFTK